MGSGSSFSIVPFAEVADFTNGYAFGPAEWGTSGLPIIRIQQLLNPAAETDRCETAIGDRYLIDTGDLVMSWSGTIAVVRWDRGPAWLNQHLFRVDPRSGVDGAFLKHVLDSSIAGLEAAAHGTTMKHIKRSDLLRYEVLLPPVEEQRRIAEILDTIDELVQRQEAVIRKHELVQHGVLAALFANDRAVPRRSLDSLCSVIVDGTHQTPNYVRDGVPFVTVQNLTRGRAISFEPCRYVSARAHADMARVIPRAGDVLVSKDGTLGVARLVPANTPAFSFFVSVALLRPTGVLAPELIRAFFDTGEFEAQLGGLSAGSGLKHIHLEHFRQFQLPVPGPDEQKRAVEVLRDFDKLLDLERLTLSKLNRTRAGLAADLLTGRVRTVAR